MISDRDRAAIDAHVSRLRVGEWRGLDDQERDLVKRALAPPTTDDDHQGGDDAA